MAKLLAILSSSQVKKQKIILKLLNLESRVVIILLNYLSLKLKIKWSK
jgi:hypothetical protein